MKKAILLATVCMFSAVSAYAVQDNSAAVSGSNNDVNQITGNNNALVTGSGAFGSSSNATATGGAGGNGGSATANGGAASATGGRSESTSALIGSGNGAGFGIGGGATVEAKTGEQKVETKTEVTNDFKAQKRNPVSTAYSGQLVAADDTCMGSTSAGAQAIGFGLSIGSTYQDSDCVRRKDARELHNMGLKDAGIALMCQNANVRKAMLASGHNCPETESSNVDDLIGLSVVETPTNGSRNR